MVAVNNRERTARSKPDPAPALGPLRRAAALRSDGENREPARRTLLLFSTLAARVAARKGYAGVFKWLSHTKGWGTKLHPLERE